MKRFLLNTLVFVSGSILFAGIPLVIWGVSDYQAYFENPARLVYSILIVLIQLLAVLFISDLAHNSGKGEKNIRAHVISTQSLKILSIAVVVLAPYSDKNNFYVFPDLEFLRFIGLVLAIIGLIYMYWSVKDLDKQFSVDITIQKDHQLITTGFYRYVRHPRYLGILAFFGGYALVFLSSMALLLSILMIPLLLWRINDEEKLLAQTFGKDWESYREKSWRMLPFIY